MQHPLSSLYNSLCLQFGSPRHQIAEWAKDDISTLRYPTRMKRINYIQNFLLDTSKHIGEPDARNAYLELRFKEEINQAEKLLLSLDYSENFKNLFDRIAVSAFKKLNEKYHLDRLKKFYPGFDEEKRTKWLQVSSDIYFECAKEILPDILPDIKPATVVLSDEFDNAPGWICPTGEQITTGAFGPIYMHKIMQNILVDTDTIFHEAAHHLTLQMASLAARKIVSFIKPIQHDLRVKQIQIENKTVIGNIIPRLHRADPDEKISLRTGTTVRFMFCATSNLGTSPQAFQIIEDMAPYIDAAAQNRPISGIRDLAHG